MIALVIGLAVVVSLLRGGRLRSDITFRQGWIVPAALAVQFLTFWLPDAAPRAALMIASYVALVYCLARNAHYQSLRVVLLGVLLNLIVLVANGGRVPVDIDVARQVGVDVSAVVSGADPRHSIMSPQSRLTFLGDVVPIPWPARVVSVGDVFLFLGVFLLVQDVMGKRVSIGVGAGES